MQNFAAISDMKGGGQIDPHPPVKTCSQKAQLK